jgi:hypothetical protein
MTTPPPTGSRHAAASRRFARGTGRSRAGRIRLRTPGLIVGLVILGLAGAGVAAANVAGQPSTVIIESAPVSKRPAFETSSVAEQSVPRHSEPAPPPVTSAHVRYELLGPPLAGFVTFSAARPGLVEPRSPVQLPWRTEFDASQGFIPTITAQNAGEGAISCRITVDGAVVSDVTSDGEYAVATCTGNVIAGD